MKSQKTGLVAGAVLLATVPIVMVCIYIALMGQSVPFWDEWMEPLDNAIKTAEGRITFSDLVRQYNDSRPFFTNLMTMISTHLLSWNLKAEMYANVALASGTLILAWWTYRSHDSGGAPYILVPFSILIFSPTQHVSWLWSIQSQYFFLLLFLMAGLGALACLPTGRGPLVVAALAALAATFSFANGFLVWFVMVPVLWMCGYRKKRHYVSFLICMALGLGAFFFGYEFNVSSSLDPRKMIGAIRFLLGYLGNGLRESGLPMERTDIWVTQLVGGSGMLLMAINLAFLRYRRRSWRALAPWVGLGSFVVISGSLAGWARVAEFGVGGALSGRYTTLSSAFWWALLALSFLSVREVQRDSNTGRSVVIANGLAGVLVAGCLLQATIRCARFEPRVANRHRECLEMAPQSRNVECLKGLHPVFDPAHPSYAHRHLALEKIDRMSELQIGVFSPREQ